MAALIQLAGDIFSNHLRNFPQRQWASPNLPAEFTNTDFNFHESSKYTPLEVSHQGITRRPPSDFQTFAGRMNLVVASKRSPHIFIAHEDRIGVLETPAGHGVCELGTYERYIDRPFPDDDSQGYLIAPYPYAITNMHVGEIGGEEVLIAADDSGHVCIHFPQDPSRPPLVVNVPISAWGIDTHSSKRLLAISCNAHIITMFHLGMGINGWEWTTAMPLMGELFPHIVLGNHSNNIPCVAFDKTGTYIVSGSLDCTIRLWECKTGQMLRIVNCQDQVWAVRFVSINDFKSYQRTDEEKAQSIKAQANSIRFRRSKVFKHDLRALLRKYPGILQSNSTSQTPAGTSMGVVEEPIGMILGDETVPLDNESISDDEDYLSVDSEDPWWNRDTSRPANTTTSNRDHSGFEAILKDQPLLYTEGSTLSLLDPVQGWIPNTNEEPIRRSLKLSTGLTRREYVFVLDVVSEVSMVFVASPCRSAWVYRMVYFPDWDLYDLIPEYKFPESMGIVRKGQSGNWPIRNTTYYGAVVQPWPAEPRREEDTMGIGIGRMGVKVVTVLSDGEASWWTVKRKEDEQVGTDSIVL